MGNDLKLEGYFDKILTEEEKLWIEKVFCANKMGYEAVRKVLLQGLYTQGTIQKGVEVDPLVNGALSLAALSTGNPIPDAEVGASVKAMWAGLNSLKNSFDTLNLIKSKPVEEKTPTVNPGV